MNIKSLMLIAFSTLQVCLSDYSGAFDASVAIRLLWRI